MQTIYDSAKENKKNLILFSLGAIVIVTFLFTSYNSDTLGKFTQSFNGKYAVLPILKDSYGNACSPNSNYGSQDIVTAKEDPIGCRYGASSGDRQAYLKFDSSKLSKDFTNAKLFIKLNGENKGKFIIYPVKKDWNENGVRWNGPVKDKYWEFPGISPNELDISNSIVFEVNSNDYVSIDITKIAKYWANGNPNYGVMIRAVEGSIEFSSKESNDNPFVIVSV